MLADKGYDGDDVRQNLLIHGILPVIPSRTNRREPIPHNVKSYKDRNLVERMVNVYGSGGNSLTGFWWGMPHQKPVAAVQGVVIGRIG